MGAPGRHDSAELPWFGQVRDVDALAGLSAAERLRRAFAWVLEACARDPRCGRAVNGAAPAGRRDGAGAAHS